jgi:RNA polymerase sigma-70 factor (ECF subfamily)
MDDAELVARVASAAAGDASEAERTFCERYGARVVRYAQRHLRDRHAAADLVQEVLLTALAAMRQGAIANPERLGSFVLSTCRHLVWDENRAAARRRRLELEAAAGAGDEAVVRPAVGELDVRALERCTMALSPRERSVVLLTYCEDWEVERIASALDTTAGNVRVIRHRALARLARCIDERGGA